MVIVPVDNHDLSRGTPQGLGGLEATKPCPNDHHFDLTFRHSVSLSWRHSQPASLVAKFATTL